MTSAEPKTLIELPFEERRYIAVVSDEDFKEQTTAVEPDGSAGSVWPVAGMIASAFIPGGLILRAGLAVTSLAVGIYTARRGSKPQPISDSVIPVTMRQTTELMFRGGSAEIGQVYAANPVNDVVYYQIGSYNDDVVDHKLSELERLLNSLGAKHYRVSYEDSDSSQSSLSANAKRVATVNLEAEVTRARKRRFERSGTSDGGVPALPDNLVWFHREPSWQALAEARIKGSRKEFTLTVELEQSLKLSAKALADIKAMKLSVDAGHHKSTNLALSVTGSF